jgi:hypothetical protein
MRNASAVRPLPGVLPRYPPWGKTRAVLIGSTSARCRVWLKDCTGSWHSNRRAAKVVPGYEDAEPAVHGCAELGGGKGPVKVSFFHGGDDTSCNERVGRHVRVPSLGSAVMVRPSAPGAAERH